MKALIEINQHGAQSLRDHRTVVINTAVNPCCSIGDCCACYRCRWYQRVEKQTGNLCTSLVAYGILIHLVVREICQQNTSLISTSSISIKVQKGFSLHSGKPTLLNPHNPNASQWQGFFRMDMPEMLFIPYRHRPYRFPFKGAAIHAKSDTVRPTITRTAFISPGSPKPLKWHAWGLTLDCERRYG